MCYSKQRVKDAARHQSSPGNDQSQKSSASINPSDITNDITDASPKEENSVSPKTNKLPITEDMREINLNDHEDNKNTVSAQGKILNQTSCQGPSAGLGKIKQVHLHKHDSDELGMAILGGIEHGLPIMISEVFPGSSVGRSQKVIYISWHLDRTN